MIATIRIDLKQALFSFALSVSAVVALPGASSPVSAQGTVNVYNWSDYVEPTVIEAFTKETGIKVKYDTFDANETLETKLLAGRSGYDVVTPTAYFLERQIKAGIFQKLDKSRLKNLGNVWPEIAKRLAAYDPGNEFAVNYMWGTTGIGYNVARAREALKVGGSVTDAMANWDVVFKPENLARFKDCGVHMLDSPDDVMTAALKYLGLNPNSQAQGDLEKAADLMMKIRPHVRKFHSSEYLNALASGEICLVLGWSGDVKQAQKRAAEARGNVEVAYAIPKGGAQMWFDNFAIPKDARNVAAAHAFIDYMLRPEVAAKNSNFLSYANGNLASQKLIDKAVLEDKTVYPDAATMASLYTISARDQRTQRTINRLWTRIKTGR
ncbi:MAG: polyamine ABC transporter substrate-binding protein [Alphaproteobacteria bacterium]|nr:polyamine ABC transporter substrate-binding protein [Alphaproteobacteria bacterium]